MSFAIATPIFDGKPHHAFAESLALSYRAHPELEWLKLPGCADVSLARNTLAARFVRKTHAAMVFVDADISWRVEDLELVMAPILAGAAHVVCGLYPKKQPGLPNYTSSLLAGDVDEERGYIGPVKLVGQRRYGRTGVVGCGFLALSREAVEAGLDVSPKYCPWKGQSITNGLDERHALLFFPDVYEDPRQPGIPRFWGEDAAGCGVLQKLGFETWFSFEAELAHHTSEFAFGGEKPDVNFYARRLALANDVMRMAAHGKPIDDASYVRRTEAILKR